jgi:hypothetical protein
MATHQNTSKIPPLHTIGHHKQITKPKTLKYNPYHPFGLAREIPIKTIQIKTKNTPIKLQPLKINPIDYCYSVET